MSTTLKISYAAIMLFALFIDIGGKYPAFGRLFVADEPVGYTTGDQYRMCEWGIMKRAVEAEKEGLRRRKGRETVQTGCR